MRSKITKKVAIMTSGGDAPGMNACLYYLFKECNKLNYEVYFILDAYKGLCENKIYKQYKEDLKAISLYKENGGTILGSVRYKEFSDPKNHLVAATNLKNLGINNLVILGGNGSFHGGFELSKFGINVQCIPFTIDNDLFFTDFTVGFMSAVYTNVDCISKIRDTMRSHHRFCLVETMGNKCGDITLFSGVLSNADVIYVPELFSDYETFKNIIKEKSDKNEINIAVVSEAISHVDELSKKVKEDFPALEIKTNNIAYIQRGGCPCKIDLELSKLYAYRAISNIKYNIYNKAIGIRENKIIDMNLDEVFNITSHRSFNQYDDIVREAKKIDNIK